MSSRTQKRELEKELKKLGIKQKVSVVQLEDGTYGYGFRFYTWTFEQLRAYITKRGFHYNACNEGKETRMWQAWLASEVRTDKLLMPTLLEDQDIVLICPKELNAKQATEFAKRVDSLVNQYTKKWKRTELLKGLKNVHRLGNEAYEISDKDWKEQVDSAYAAACLEFKSNPIIEAKTKWQTQGQAQTELVFATTQFILDTSKKKGIIDSPPGTGKTLIPLFTLEYLIQNNLMPTRGISIVSAPWQSLCDKNAKEGSDMTTDNGLDIVHLTYHSAAHVKNRKKFTTSLQDASRETMYANEINFHLDRGKHVIIHVCFDSYSQLMNSIALCDIKDIKTLWIDEVHKMVSSRPTEMNAMIRNIESQATPVNKVISMTGTVDEFDLDSTFSGNAQNYSMSNKDLFGEYIKRITYGETVLQKLNLPFKVKGINRYHFDGDYVSGVKLNLTNSALGENLINSIIANVKAAQNNHEVIFSMFRINDEARVTADQLKQIKKNSNLLNDYEIRCLTTVEENDPKKRNEILSDINKDSNQKYIVLLGPWAITGSNCQRADAVLWNYVPQSYINIVQGSLRACRMLRFPDHSINELKKIFTVYFIMTEDVVKDNTFASALETLHSFMYSGNIRTYQAINEMLDDDWFGTNEDPVIDEDPRDEIIDIEPETTEEAEELSAILNRRFEDLLESSNTFDFSTTWNLSKELNKQRKKMLLDIMHNFSF